MIYGMHFPNVQSIPLFAFKTDGEIVLSYRRQNPTSKHYDYRLIYERLQAIIEAREDDDILSLVNLLRSGLVRNLGNLTAPRLFNRAYAGTKLLIEDYITQVALAVEYVAAFPTSPGQELSGLTNQAKLDVLHDTRQAFGRSALVLQGGAIFGLCHLGVVKALHLRGLLPRIICGTATGALIAALVGVHTEDELLDFLTGDGIDLTAFRRPSEKGEKEGLVNGDGQPEGILSTVTRRVKRFVKEGYFLDVAVLERCVRANVGDLTFEEAYSRTKRVLNITVSTTGGGGVPNVLNYLTAPNVVSRHAYFLFPRPVFTCRCSLHCDSCCPLLDSLICPDTNFSTAHLVRRTRFQRVKSQFPLSPRHPPMSRRKRLHHSLARRQRCHLSPLDTRLVLRTRVPAHPHCRALQCEPLHRLPSTPIPSTLLTLRPGASKAPTEQPQPRHELLQLAH